MLLGKLKMTSAVIVALAAFGLGLGAAGSGPLAVAQDKPARPPLSAEIEIQIPNDPIPQPIDKKKKPNTKGFHEAELPQPTADPNEEAALKKAAVDGKYSILLKKLEMKGDRQGYGEFRDFGMWSGTSYGGHDNLPAGYWVYLYPHWYIWGEQNAAPDAEQKKAAAGKYNVLLKRIEVKGDESTYSAFHDYGYWSGTAYYHHKDIPAGYWVYVAPNWYIWGDAAQHE